jgi:hypothetical protein
VRLSLCTDTPEEEAALHTSSVVEYYHILRNSDGPDSDSFLFIFDPNKGCDGKLGGEAGLRALATPLSCGARFRMGIAIQAVSEGALRLCGRLAIGSATLTP